MPRVTKPLNVTQITAAKPKDKEYSLSDGGGLHLRVRPNGSKQWAMSYYQPFTGKRVKIGLGSFPEVGLTIARDKAKAARELLAQEIDPQNHRDEQARLNQEAHSNTFGRVAEKWMTLKSKTVTHDYAEDIWRSFNNHLLPTLGKVPLHRVKAPAVIAILEPIAAKGALETVKRLTQRINEVMTFAVNTGLLDANPLAGISKAFQSPSKTKMPTLKPEQLPELMRSLTTASIKLTTRCLIEWQLHTMVRPAEAAGARWDEINWDNKLWCIPAARMKAKRPHTVPLTEQALGLLATMRPLSGDLEYIFPADRDRKKHTNPQTANMALKRMGYQDKLVSHGLRALASTTLNEQKFDKDWIEAALAHLDSNEVRGAYNRAEYLESRRVMMNWWSNHIEQAATGNMSLAAGYKALRLVG